jgi:hypothetical protein
VNLMYVTHITGQIGRLFELPGDMPVIWE